MDGWMVGWMGGWMGGWMDGWMDGRMDGWTDGWRLTIPSVNRTSFFEDPIRAGNDERNSNEFPVASHN